MAFGFHCRTIQRVPHTRTTPREIKTQVRKLSQPGVVTTLWFSPNGRLLIVGSDAYSERRRGGLEVYRVSDWKLIKSCSDEQPVGFTPDGRYLLTLHELRTDPGTSRLS